MRDPQLRKEYNSRYQKEDYKRHPEKYRKKHILYTYGLTYEAHEEMRLNQGNCCAICKRPFVKTPCVDHDHKTGKVRGLLCNSCNGVLGKVELFGPAIQEYLKGSAT
jgi:hypothetical protein